MRRTGEGLPNDWRTIASMFMAPRFTAALRSCVVVLALLLPGPVLADGFTCAPPAGSKADSGKTGALDELEEVVVNGGKPTAKASDLSAWLKLLYGQYTYEGYVDLCGKGNAADQRPVTGHAVCGISYPANIPCEFDVSWPEARGENGESVRGGVSNLSPAVVLFGLEHNQRGIQFMQVDNKGIAERGRGALVGSTLTSREPCVGIPGNCLKITRITARPDSYDIVMLIDVEIDSRRVLRYAFLMRRLPFQRHKGYRQGAPP